MPPAACIHLLWQKLVGSEDTRQSLMLDHNTAFQVHLNVELANWEVVSPSPKNDQVLISKASILLRQSVWMHLASPFCIHVMCC